MTYDICHFSVFFNFFKFFSRLTGTEQGGRQFISLIFTLGIALVGGLITGAIIRQPIWQQPDVDQIFDDEDFWILEGQQLLNWMLDCL